MATIENSTNALNLLLEGEIAAIESYVQAIDMFDGFVHERLVEIRDDHIEICYQLRQVIHDACGEPKHHSGPWGIWVKFIEGSAKMLSNKSALVALKEGEELGLFLFEKSLEEPHLETEAKQIIRSKCIPRSATHIRTLDLLMAQV